MSMDPAPGAPSPRPSEGRVPRAPPSRALPPRPMALRIAVAVLVFVVGGPLIADTVGEEFELTTGLLFGGLPIHEDMLLADAMPLAWLRGASIGFGGVCLLAGLGMWWRMRAAWQLTQGLALAALASNLLQAVMATYEVMRDAETLRGGLLATVWLAVPSPYGTEPGSFR